MPALQTDGRRLAVFGPPRVAQGRLKSAGITFGLRQTENGVAFSVPDNGGGIDQRNQTIRQLLEPVQSGRTAGIGIGLTIVSTIAEQHGGSLRLENHPGDGLTVTLEVPRAG